MKEIKQPLINTLVEEGAAPPKRASLKKLMGMLYDLGWNIEIKINMTKSTVEQRKDGGNNG